MSHFNMLTNIFNQVSRFMKCEHCSQQSWFTPGDETGFQTRLKG